MNSAANVYNFGDSGFYMADAGQHAAPAMQDVAGGGAESWMDAVACCHYRYLSGKVSAKLGQLDLQTKVSDQVSKMDLPKPPSVQEALSGVKDSMSNSRERLGEALSTVKGSLPSYEEKIGKTFGMVLHSLEGLGDKVAAVSNSLEGLSGRVVEVATLDSSGVAALANMAQGGTARVVESSPPL